MSLSQLILKLCSSEILDDAENQSISINYITSMPEKVIIEKLDDKWIRSFSICLGEEKSRSNNLKHWSLNKNVIQLKFNNIGKIIRIYSRISLESIDADFIMLLHQFIVEYELTIIDINKLRIIQTEKFSEVVHLEQFHRKPYFL